MSSTDDTPEDSPIILDATALAQLRTRAALDRTLLAWIRTAFALEGFGFTLATYVSRWATAGRFTGFRRRRRGVLV